MATLDLFRVKNGLDVSVASTGQLTATLTTGSSHEGFRLAARNGAGTAISTEQARFAMEYNGAQATGLSFIRGAGTTDASLAIITNGAERVRVDATGSVGIGTASPSRGLHLAGGASSTVPGIRLERTGVRSWSAEVDDSGNFKLIDDTATTTRLSVSSAGLATWTGALTVSGTITGNVSGNATNVTGTVAVANGGTGSTTAAAARSTLGLAIGSNVQAWDADLDAIAALAGTAGLLKKTAANTWTLDTATYLTANQTITASGDATGSGTTAITLTLANSGVTAGTYAKVTVDAKGRVTAGAALASGDIPDLSATYQPLKSVLTSVGNLATNVTGLVKLTNGVASVDSGSYLTANQTITVSGDATGSGTTSLALTLANSGVTAGTYRSVTVDAKGRVTAGTNPTTLAGYGITDALASSTRGAVNGVASLDASGKIPAAQLPSLADDVLEYTNLAAFPATGETGKLYVALDTNKLYRWSGAAYVVFAAGAVDSVAGKTGAVTLVKADVGLTNVDNTSDASKPVSTATQSALNLKADIASPTFTGTPAAPTATAGTNTTQLATTAFVTTAVSGKQDSDADLTAIAALAGTSGLLKKTAANTWSLDTSTYLTANQTVTVSGDATGSGTTSIALTLANSGVTAGTYKSVTVDAKGRVTAGTNPTTLSGYGITDAVSSSLLGAASGVATLDASGLVPASQLPSYVDDVLEYANLAALPVTGESGKIYVTQDSNKIYRWSGSAYIEISPVAGNSDSATKLATARTISATGDASWSVSFDGSANATAALTLANSGVTAGTYRSVTVDAKGRVTAGSNPTTLAGYGITDATPSSHVGATGAAHGAATTSVAGFMSAADKTKLDGIAASANNYVHPTTDGSLHVPATGTTSSGKALVAGAAAGSFAWTTLDLSYLPDAAIKKSVRAATTANITLSATQTIDGIALAVGDRVLVKDQTTTAQNGIYVVQAAAWTRPADADASSKMAGAAVNVDSGTVNGGLRFDTDFRTTDTLGTTAMTWNRVVDTGLASSVAGAAPGTAAVGTSLSYARADHVHPLQTTVSGNAGTATKLETARTLSVSGDATGSASFDGSANAAIAVTLANSGVTAGTYNNSATQNIPLVVDAKGRITGVGTAVTITPAFSSITGKPTTLSGYGITDAVALTGTLPLAQGDFTSSTFTAATTSASQIIDSTASASYRTVKYLIQASTSSAYQASEVLVVHNGTTVQMVEYALIFTGAAALASYDADISGGNIRLLATPANANTVFRVIKTMVDV